MGQRLRCCLAAEATLLLSHGVPGMVLHHDQYGLLQQVGCLAKRRYPVLGNTHFHGSTLRGLPERSRTFINTGRQQSSLLRQWFALGIVAAGMLGVSACFIFLRELWRASGWLLQVCAGL